MLIVAARGSVIRGEVIIRFFLRENPAFPSYFSFLVASCFCIQLLKLFLFIFLYYIYLISFIIYKVSFIIYKVSFIIYKVSYIIYKVSYIFYLLLTYTRVSLLKTLTYLTFTLLGTSNKYKRDEANLYSLFAFPLPLKTLNLFLNLIESLKLYIFALNPLFPSIIIVFFSLSKYIIKDFFCI
jgi:hypothetical protein